MLVVREGRPSWDLRWLKKDAETAVMPRLSMLRRIGTHAASGSGGAAGAKVPSMYGSERVMISSAVLLIMS